jgi:hypothetical protein
MHRLADNIELGRRADLKLSGDPFSGDLGKQGRLLGGTKVVIERRLKITTGNVMAICSSRDEEGCTNLFGWVNRGADVEVDECAAG